MDKNLNGYIQLIRIHPISKPSHLEEVSKQLNDFIKVHNEAHQSFKCTNDSDKNYFDKIFISLSKTYQDLFLIKTATYTTYKYDISIFDRQTKITLRDLLIGKLKNMCTFKGYSIKLKECVTYAKCDSNLSKYITITDKKITF